MKIGIGSDHAGYEAKEKLLSLLKKEYEVFDYGCDSLDSVDYPKYAFLVGEAIQNGQINFGILICKTGIGMCIACNKLKGVRCAKVDNKEEAYLTRFHNNSNVLALSAMKNDKEIKEIVDIFLNQKFSEEERHQRRINMIDHYGE